MIKAGPNLRVRFKYLIQKIARNGKVPLTVVRSGKEVKVELPVSPKLPMVLPSLDSSYPPYFVYGPLVFSRATSDVLSGFFGERTGMRVVAALGAVGSPLLTRWGDKPAFPDEDLVVVSSPFFPHRLSKGYGNPMLEIVKGVNGVRIKNFEHLIEVLRDCKDEYITIDFDMRGAETLVFLRSQMLAATDEILTDNGVRSQGSPDAMEIWKGKAAR